jgi:hypothetical protein
MCSAVSSLFTSTTRERRGRYGQLERGGKQAWRLGAPAQGGENDHVQPC